MTDEVKMCVLCGDAFRRNGLYASWWKRRNTCGRSCAVALSWCTNRASREKQRVADFWASIDRSDADGCWPWTAGTDRDGYGQFSWRNKNVRAHCMAWALTHGPIPRGLSVLHHCDNPPCCNPGPRHLFVGTQIDNVNDMIAKDRNVRGSRVGTSVLTDDAVATIKSRLRDGMTQTELASQSDVSQSAISSIARGLTWRHVVAVPTEES